MVLVDSNIWFAVNDRSAAAHAACVEWVATNRGDLAVTAPVAAETGWLLLDRFGPDKANSFLNPDSSCIPWLITFSGDRVQPSGAARITPARS
jgi:predicted nucleic acid-binding protein